MGCFGWCLLVSAVELLEDGMVCFTFNSVNTVLVVLVGCSSLVGDGSI